MYTVGKQLVPLHTLCGEWYEILNPNGVRFCVIVGNYEQAQAVAYQLNNGVR